MQRMPSTQGVPSAAGPLSNERRQVPEELDYLTAEVDRLSIVLDRLQPVVGSEVREDKAMAVPRQPLCPLAERLRDLRERIAEAATRIESVEL